jgi:glycosyltransferase involved in cell wall biosynthesis
VPVNVTVGLCLKNADETVKNALDSISRQDYPHEYLKLVIVDEEKKGTTPSSLTDFNKKTDIKTALFFVQNKGLGAARQIVVDNAEGDYIVWVDDDFVFKQDFISKLVEFMDKNPVVGAARAKQLVKKTTLLTALDSYLRIISSPIMETQPVGDCLIFRVKAIRQVGGFDVKIRGATEDLDISHKITHAGWALAINNLALLYKKNEPNSWNALWRKHYWYGYGSHFFLHKYKERKKRIALLPLFAFAVGFRDSFRVFQLNHEKKAFVLGLYCFYRNTASCLGYINAHFDGYGHIAND